jgi:hypothetical protein
MWPPEPREIVDANGTYRRERFGLTVGCGHSLDATDVLPLSSLG